MHTQNSVDLYHLQDRLARLERLFDDLSSKAGETAQGLALSWPNATGGGSGFITRGVTAASIASGASGSVALYDDTGALTGISVTANLWLSGTVASGTKVYVEPVGGGWDIVQADCP